MDLSRDENRAGWFHKLHDPVSGLMHLGAAVVAAAGLAVMLWLAWGSSLLKISSLLLYGLSVILLFSASAAYHLANASPAVMLRLRKFDHSAIYLLIAGSYTPICLHFFTGLWRWGIPAVIWTMALAGVGVKLFVIRAPRWVTAGIYLLMGWMAVIGIREILATMPPGALGWLVAGGLFYTVGAVGYILKKPDPFPGVFGFHEIWHIFVILGALSHYLLVAMYVAPG